MTTRTVKLGGTDWSDGEVLFAADQNDTFNAVTTHRKQFTYGTAITHTGDTDWTTVGTTVGGDATFTITNALNALVTGIRFKCDIKTNGGGASAQSHLRMTGDNLGTAYIGIQEVGLTGANDETRYPGIVTTEEEAFKNVETSFKQFECYVGPLKLEDETTTFTVRQKTSNGSQVSSIQNIEIEVIYVSAFKED